MFKKLWLNIFSRVALILLITCLAVIIANQFFLLDFFVFREEKLLNEQMSNLAKADVLNSQEIRSVMSKISEKHNADVEIYRSDGIILYTTAGSKMMDFFETEFSKFSMVHIPIKPIKEKVYSNGTVISQTENEGSEKASLVCTKELSDGIYGEIRIRMELLENSAFSASAFTTAIIFICAAIALIWITVFAKKFSSPITQMTEITKRMADKKFDKRLNIERKDEIKQLADSVNDMADSLSKTLSDLESANIQLKKDILLKQQIDDMRKEFVADVSHELKTPVSIIRGYAEGLKSDLSEEKKNKYCDIIIDESIRMNELVLSILQLSKYEAETEPNEKTEFDLYALSKALGERVFADKIHCYKSEIAENTVVTADKTAVEKVLKCYLENANSHLSDGGKVIIFAKAEDGKTKISVYNDGETIEEEKLPLLWQSFYRGDTSHKRDNSRFGLGLSIVKAICEKNGYGYGVMNLENGVCFWLTI